MMMRVTRFNPLGEHRIILSSVYKMSSSSSDNGFLLLIMFIHKSKEKEEQYIEINYKEKNLEIIIIFMFNSWLISARSLSTTFLLAWCLFHLSHTGCLAYTFAIRSSTSILRNSVRPRGLSRQEWSVYFTYCSYFFLDFYMNIIEQHELIGRLWDWHLVYWWQIRCSASGLKLVTHILCEHLIALVSGAGRRRKAGLL